MKVDVLVNSCARPDLLEKSINTFSRHMKSDLHTFRWVLVEDKVDDESRQLKGKIWIKNHIHLFDKVVLLKEKAGPGYWWAKTIEQCESDFHIHLEDDCKFITDFNIDPIIDLLIRNENIVEIIFRRDKLKNRNQGKKVTLENIPLTLYKSFSVATGIFNTNNVRKIIDVLGWDQQLHEATTLCPTSKKLNLQRYILGHNEVHYMHEGQQKCYRKGKWKEK